MPQPPTPVGRPIATEDGSDAVTRHEGHDHPDEPGSSAASETLTDQPFRIGRYTILRRLGRGGMGVVYAAYDDKLDRKIALKLVYVSRERGTIGQARLLREAQALARLSHPNVVQVYEVGEHDRQVFLAMEFVSGVTLRSWSRAQRRPWREVLDLYQQAGRGLAAAHAVGLIHRDFKPDNALIADDGRVRVLDFGLARAVLGDPDEPQQPVPLDSLRSSASLDTQDLSEPLTAVGLLLGTPAYMSPEQLLRQPTDARSDQYSFCVALWEALHGARPFKGRTLGELKLQVFAGPPKHPRGPVPAWLGRVLTRGLAVSPAQRFADMDALLRALADDPAQRRRRRALAVVTSLVLAGGGAAGYALTTADSPTCKQDDALIGVWDPATRAAISTRFTSLELPFADQAFERAAAELDAYAARLQHLLQTTCEARERGLRKGRALELQVECAERLRGELAALTVVLRDADARAVERVAQAVTRLPPVEPCNDVRSLLAADELSPAPGNPALAARVRAQAPRLASVRAELDAGHHERGRELAREICDEAERLGHAPLLAEALVLLGNAELACGDYPASGATPSTRLQRRRGRQPRSQRRRGGDPPGVSARRAPARPAARADLGRGRRRQAAPPRRHRPRAAPAPGVQRRQRAARRRPAQGQRAALPRGDGDRRAAPRRRPGLLCHRPQRARDPRDGHGQPRRRRAAAAPLAGPARAGPRPGPPAGRRRPPQPRPRPLPPPRLRPRRRDVPPRARGPRAQPRQRPPGHRRDPHRPRRSAQRRRRHPGRPRHLPPRARHRGAPPRPRPPRPVRPAQQPRQLADQRPRPARRRGPPRARPRPARAPRQVRQPRLRAAALQPRGPGRRATPARPRARPHRALPRPARDDLRAQTPRGGHRPRLPRRHGAARRPPDQAEAHANQAVAVLTDIPAGVLELGRARVVLANLRARDPATRDQARNLARQAVLDLREQPIDSNPHAEARRLLTELSRRTP